jgi:TPR repeat protein
MEKGNADAFRNLAGYYAGGDHGIPQDMAKANELFLKAGELGSAKAYCNLGYSYIHGRGGTDRQSRASKQTLYSCSESWIHDFEAVYGCNKINGG